MATNLWAYFIHKNKEEEEEEVSKKKSMKDQT